jgi:hypothetical protein
MQLYGWKNAPWWNISNYMSIILKLGNDFLVHLSSDLMLFLN